MAAGLRVDLYRVDSRTDVDDPPDWEWRWRTWSSSRKIGAATEGYVHRPAALRNLETMMGGVFTKTATPDLPKPYGWLDRPTPDSTQRERIPVRLVVS